MLVSSETRTLLRSKGKEEGPKQKIYFLLEEMSLLGRVQSKVVHCATYKDITDEVRKTEPQVAKNHRYLGAKPPIVGRFLLFKKKKEKLPI